MKLSKWDDYLVHQIAEPMDTLGTESPNFMDRIWFMAYTQDGDLQMMAGLGSHPNKNIMDGFLLVRHRGLQRNLRLSRHVNGDRSDPTIGPLRFEVVEPQEHWRIELAPNEFEIACSLDFRARTVPFLFPRLGFKDQEQLHYKQPGRATGTITFQDQKFDVSAIPSVRDRSWGFRKPGIVSGLGILVVVEAHFGTSAASLIYLDTLSESFRMRQGALIGDDGTVTPVVDIQQRVEFNSSSKLFEHVELRVIEENGKSRKLTAEAISAPCYFTGGGYDGRHGLDYGPMHLEGECWDVSKGGNVGGVFPYYSRICRLSLDGEPGIGHVEAFFCQDPNWSYQPTLTR